MVVCWITVHSEESRFDVRFMLKDKPDNSYFLCIFSIKRQVSLGKVRMLTRIELLDIVIVDGKARGILQETWLLAN